MSSRERERMIVLEAVKRGEVSVGEAARRMGLSRRQTIRLKRRYLTAGAGGIVHRARGRRPGNRSQGSLPEQAIALYREQYAGFGPTLAAEKMAERDGVIVVSESLRRWLIDSGDWEGPARGGKHHQRRAPRARFGELLQIDGSPHAWFGPQRPRCCLMVLVDDATGRFKLFLAAEETTMAALVVLRKWVTAYGVPVEIYADRNTVYWAPTALAQPQLRDQRHVHSEWGRVAVGNLGIGLIPAHSPQAKGRVERLNAMLQDRLVKELALRGITDIESANAMLDEFADELSARFAKTPLDPRDAHRVFAPQDARAAQLAFSVDFERTVARDHTLSFQGACWQIPPQAGAPRPGAQVTLWRAMDGAVRCLWQGRELIIERYDPKAQRFRQRLQQATAQGEDEEDEAPAAPASRTLVGDPSPTPPGIYRIHPKAARKKEGGGIAHHDHPAPASVSDTALGSRPRVALSSGRTRPVSHKPPPPGR